MFAENLKEHLVISVYECITGQSHATCGGFKEFDYRILKFLFCY
jgi:hypothetical protein